MTSLKEMVVSGSESFERLDKWMILGVMSGEVEVDEMADKELSSAG
jgi:tellurite resistance-related uncharacterized protein